MMHKKSHGEGTERLRKDGRWEFSVRTTQGKRFSVYGKTRKEMAEKKRALLREIEQGADIGSSRQKVEQYLTNWLQTVKRDVRPSTYAYYASHVQGHLIPALGGLRLGQVTPEHVDRLLDAMLERGLSAGYVRNTRAVLHRALDMATRRRVLSLNAAGLSSVPRVESKEPAFLSPEQARRFLAACSGDRLEALFVVGLSLGLRHGEVLGLRWQDVDLERGVLTVQHTLQRIGGRLTLVAPKTSQSRRRIAMPEVVIHALRAHKARQALERRLAGDRWREHGLVFSSTLGTPLDHVKVTARLRAILDDAGLDRLRFHDLRHSCASLLLAQGVHPKVVQGILGHSSIAMTLRYSHALEEAGILAAAKLDEVLQEREVG